MASLKTIQGLPLAMLLLSIAGLSMAAPANDVDILEYKNEVNPDGSYDFSFVQSDGTKREEHGEPLPGEEGGMSVRGFYSYMGPDGVEYRVDYESNEGGFQPSGAHLPSGTGAQAASPAIREPTAPRLRISPAALASLVG